MSALELKLIEAEAQLESARERGSSSVAQREEMVKELKKQVKEEKIVKPHPHLQFGPIQQTIAIMSAVSLAMSIAPLPYEVMPFYHLFATLTMAAVFCLVGYTSIIWYGYNQALAKIPKPNPEAKWEAFKKARQHRPDDWAHSRSHPSHFLTTKNAPPRLFPFPLGKTRPEATVKDELWWEGGNAPHVGHYNKPPLPPAPAFDEKYLLRKVEKNMEMEKQRNIWKKRINTVKALSLVVIVGFVNQKIGVAGLCVLIYWTLHTEIQNMLRTPSDDMEEIYHEIDTLVHTSKYWTQSAIKPDRDNGYLAGGMAYLYDPTSSGDLVPNSNIPIQGVVPPPVGMTSENHRYAGPGEPIKRDDE